MSFKDHSKFENKRPFLLWKCEHCGKLISYMSYFCNECAEKLLGKAPKPFDQPAESEDKE